MYPVGVYMCIEEEVYVEETGGLPDPIFRLQIHFYYLYKTRRPDQTRPDQTNLFYLHVYSYLTNKYR